MVIISVEVRKTEWPPKLNSSTFQSVMAILRLFPTDRYTFLSTLILPGTIIDWQIIAYFLKVWLTLDLHQVAN